MKYIASVSFGKDSLAMLLRLLEENKPLDAVVFYNTGMEFECIYHIRDKIKATLVEKGIEYVELTPRRPFLYSMFDKPVKSMKTGEIRYGYSWCGGGCRWGTSEKMSAIKKYKSTLGDDVVDYVGIAADEIPRIERAGKDKMLPLVEWGMTERDCLKYCRERGYYWTETARASGECVDLYDVLDRVSCWCCSNKNKKELFNIWKYLPQYWERLKELQSKTDRPMKKFKSKKHGAYGNVFDMERVFEMMQ